MAENDYTDFDKTIRSLLADAGEEVPEHLAEDLFARMDMAGRKKNGIPHWLRYAAVTAAAAALLVTVFLFLNNETQEPLTADASIKETEQTVTIPESGISEALTCGTETGIDIGTGLNGTEVGRKMKESEDSRPEGQIPAEASDSGKQEKATYGMTEDEYGLSSGHDGHKDVAESPENTDRAYDTEDDSSSDPFSLMEEDSRSRQASAVSLTAGGNVASNGDPKGLSSGSGLRTPEQMINGEWIEQTGKESSYSIPVSVGVGVNIALNGRWGINTGLRYSMLQRKFFGVYTKITDGKTVASISSNIRHTVHYLGIPVQGYFNILNGQKVRLYAYAGGEVEKALANVYRIKDVRFRDGTKGVQLSVNGGFGIEFSVADHLGIYLNPGAVYYFDCDQPVSIRTQQPFMMNFEVGLRVNL